MSHALLIAPSLYGCDNDILLGALDDGHGRLLGTVSLPPGGGDLALDRLAARGVRGIRLNWIADRRPDATTLTYRRLLERAARRGAHRGC